MGESGAALQDGRGCLTAAGFQALARAPVGQAPPELAAHVASCSRCQDRLLGALPAGVPARREVKAPPPLWRTWAVLLAAILMTLAALLLGRWLSGR